jgi:hypothetical protein
MGHSQFMESVRKVIRVRNLALSTEKTYCYWARYFIRRQCYTRASQIQPHGVDDFLSFIAIKKHVAPNLQSQALCALVFLFRYV